MIDWEFVGENDAPRSKLVLGTSSEKTFILSLEDGVSLPSIMGGVLMMISMVGTASYNRVGAVAYNDILDSGVKLLGATLGATGNSEEVGKILSYCDEHNADDYRILKIEYYNAHGVKSTMNPVWF